MNVILGVSILFIIMWSVIGGSTYLDMANSYEWDAEYSKGQIYFIKFACGPLCWICLAIGKIIDLMIPLWDKFWNWLGTIK